MRLPHLAYNFVSAVGAAIALLVGTAAAALLVVSLLEPTVNPYVGILLYVVLPAFLVLGLVLIPVGMLFRRRRLRSAGVDQGPPFAVIDLNVPATRNAALLFVGGTLGFVLLSTVGAYQAYHYTESVSFCGSTCHSVMRPEYTAYQSSPHARVPCVDCHIGSGASWFVRSKLSGAYQVYATLAGVYPRPIPTPISNLRPAQETCEQCHWPEKFYGGQQRIFHHYMYDEENTHWPVELLIKTGGGDPETGRTSGIHWHMNIAVRVEYIARDAKRQDIPWVRVTDRKTGRATVYEDGDNPLPADAVAAAVPRVMDCMDCHDRPSHRLSSPDQEIDAAILTNRIDATLPLVKSIAVDAIAQSYATPEVASTGIASRIADAYRLERPELYAQRRAAIDHAILSTQQAYRRSIFPQMKARWDVYPDNVGHLVFPGCMRCHDGGHRSEEGLVLSRDCTTCHVILSQGSGDRAESASGPEGLLFQHPADIGDDWQETSCSDCHSGTQPG